MGTKIPCINAKQLLRVQRRATKIRLEITQPSSLALFLLVVCPSPSVIGPRLHVCLYAFSCRHLRLCTSVPHLCPWNFPGGLTVTSRSSLICLMLCICYSLLCWLEMTWQLYVHLVYFICVGQPCGDCLWIAALHDAVLEGLLTTQFMA